MTFSPAPLAAARTRYASSPHARTWRQIGSFATIGVLSTLAYVALYAVLREAMSAALANGVALLITAVGNTAANRRLTFGVRGRSGLGRHHVAGMVAFGMALAITSTSIGLLQATVARPGRILEITVLVAANVLATVLRFLLLRLWIDDGAVTGSQGTPADDPITTGAAVSTQARPAKGTPR